MWLLVLVLSWFALVIPGSAIGVNWGTQASHPLDPDIVVRMLRDNGFQKVKLFDANPGALKALGKSGIGVMVGIPNDMLGILANSVEAAENWVSKNVSFYVSNHGVTIRYVAVGNEPFLQSNNGSYLQTIFPALQNIQSSLIKAGLSNQVKVTIPLNADVYQSSTGVPSGGDFRDDIHDLMLTITKFINDNDGVFTTNIYPFISLYSDPNFPGDYAFFDGSSHGLKDGGTTYDNMLDANHDTLVWALRKYGYENLPIIIGEIGWPTDGDRNANLAYAQRFSQGLIKHILNGNGTPMRPGPIDAYIFSLIDEDEKTILPGNFERHWGIFYYDGSPKYQLNLGTNPNSTSLVAAKGVKYLKQKWCVLKQGVSLDDPNIADSVSYACGNADCTCLGFGNSCSDLDAMGNISYAFNNYFQKFDQYNSACEFPNLSVITFKNPSRGNCRFNIMIQTSAGLGMQSFGMVSIGLVLGMQSFGMVSIGLLWAATLYLLKYI